MPDCTAAEHDAAKIDPLAFRSQTAFVGYQRGPDEGSFAELRTCPRCGSTLTILVDAINHDWVLFMGTCQIRQLNANAELVQEDRHSPEQRRTDIAAARDHLRRALALLRRHLPEELR